MKSIGMKLFSLIGLSLLFMACNDVVVYPEEVNDENLYVIKEGATTDSVQNKRYEIFQKYNVPVYFNDTIGRNYMQKSFTGDSVFVYELLDLSWKFTSRSGNFSFEYFTDEHEKMNALRFIDLYLSKTSLPIRPFSIFVPKTLTSDVKMSLLEYSENQNITFYIGTRTLVLSGISEFYCVSTLEEQLKMTDNVLKMSIKDRVLNLTSKLNAFFMVSNKDYYDKQFTKLDASITGFGGTFLLSDVGAQYYIENYGYTQDQVEEERMKIRSVVGKFGFVDGDIRTSYFSPQSYNIDLEIYIDEMTRYSKTEFEKLWGAYPLVMKKYEILYRLIENELDIKL